MILTPGKSQFMCLSKNLDNNEVLNFNNLTIESSKEVEILGMTIFSSENTSNLHMRQKQLLYKSMIKSQINYCPLVWMFCSRKSSNLINKIHGQSLRFSYKDQKASYQNLLETHNELTIHQRNLQALITEIYKIVNGVTSPIMNSLFEFRSNKDNIRNFQVHSADFRRTVNYVIETVTYRQPSPM